MTDPYAYNVHAVLADGSKIVRYADGTWGQTWTPRMGVPWRRLKMPDVVQLATDATEVHYGLPRGRVFDRLVKEARGDE
jgi:hypothetical protein